MLSRITEKTFYKYIKCPNWVYFDVHKDEDKLHEPLMEKLIEDGLLREKQMEVVTDRQDLCEVTAEDPDEAFSQTLAFMAEGRQTIFRGVLVDKHWVGNPDLLEKVEGKSKLGNYYYVAADIKRSSSIKDDYKFQGCFYAELLEKVQGVKPVQGYVVNSTKEVMPFVIDEFEAEFGLTLSEIEKIVTGDKPTHFVTSGCKQSPWFKECREESEICEDLSLLNRVWRNEVSVLNDAGVKTITELSLKSVTDLERLAPNLSLHRLETMRDQAIAIKDGRHMIRANVEMPEAKVDLYFDIESDPLRDFDYLFGILAVEDGQEKYDAFFAQDPSQEAEMWNEFIMYIERHIDSPIYHYGWFEKVVINRFAAKYGISEIAREALDRNMIDLLELLRPSVIFPLSFYSLKDIASYIGFKWRSDDASGANSVLWFEEWFEDKSKKDLLQKIYEYNEDDVIATYKLQRWLRENASL